MRIGFIGLGIMGSRMAKNLIKAGYPLNVYNRTKLKAEKLEGAHLHIMESPAQVAAESDVIITMLSTPEVVQEVALGEDGLVNGMSKGKVWIDCSTVNPSFSVQMAELAEQLGFNFLDAPVAGSLAPAENGELVFLVGGKKTIVKYVMPLFKVMGKKTIHVGDAGQGSALKLVNNLVMGLSFYAFTEGLVLGESLGIDKNQIFDLMEGSPVAAQMIMLKKNKLLNAEFSPEFPLQWLQKDLHLAAQTAYEQGATLPGTNNVKEIFALAKQAGLAEKDFSAIYQFLSKKAQ
ncbi:MAG TPA: NAD(P)-dependent oxidoreductase [Bacteroidales bacterium]|nr:NAD(P)-dependent oxidoreductase [Bacteroidales bacterium]HRX98155.1 NAD(P)-dependent oxidoreductase [Bacteroidales bacterium]